MRRLFLALWLLAWPTLLLAMLAPIPADLVPGDDKLAHALGYAGMTLLGALGVARMAWFLLLVAATLALACGLEVVQVLVPWRSFEAADLAANAAGILAGTGLGAVWLTLGRARVAAARSA